MGAFVILTAHICEKVIARFPSAHHGIPSRCFAILQEFKTPEAGPIINCSQPMVKRFLQCMCRARSTTMQDQS